VEASRKRKEPEVAVTVAASPVPAAPPSATHPRGEEAAGGPAAAAGSCAAATPAEEPPLDSGAPCHALPPAGEALSHALCAR